MCHNSITVKIRMVPYQRNWLSTCHFNLSTMRRLPPPRLLSWVDWREWAAVAAAIGPAITGAAANTSSWPDAADVALPSLHALISRGRAPLAVHASHQLLSLLLQDARLDQEEARASAPHLDPAPARRSPAVIEAARDQVRMGIALSLQRMVNGLADTGQRGAFAASVFDLASRVGLPRVLVDLRHESAHGALPSLAVLQFAAITALEWLWNHYWANQAGHTIRQLEMGVALGLPHRPAPEPLDVTTATTAQIIEAIGKRAWASVARASDNPLALGSLAGGAAVRGGVPERTHKNDCEDAWFDIPSVKDLAAGSEHARKGVRSSKKAGRRRAGARGIDDDGFLCAFDDAVSLDAPLVQIDVPAAEAYKRAVAKAAAAAMRSADDDDDDGGGSAVARVAAAIARVPRPALPQPLPAASAAEAAGAQSAGTKRVRGGAPPAASSATSSIVVSSLLAGADAAHASLEASLLSRVAAGLKEQTRGAAWLRWAVAEPLVTLPGGLLRPPAQAQAGPLSAGSRTDASARPLSVLTASAAASTPSASSGGDADRGVPSDGAYPLTSEGLTAGLRSWSGLLLALSQLHPALPGLLVTLLLQQAEAATVARDRPVAVRALSWVHLLTSRHWASLAQPPHGRGSGSTGSGSGSRLGGDWQLAVMTSASLTAPSSTGTKATTGSSGASTATGGGSAPLASFLLASTGGWKGPQAAWMAAPAPLASLCRVTQHAHHQHNNAAGKAGAAAAAGKRGFPWPALGDSECGVFLPLVTALRRWLGDPGMARSSTLAALLHRARACGVDTHALAADVAASLLSLTAEREEGSAGAPVGAVPEEAPVAATAQSATATAALSGAGGGAGGQLDIDALEALLGAGGSDDGDGVPGAATGAIGHAGAAAPGAVSARLSDAAPQPQRKRPRWTVGAWMH